MARPRLYGGIGDHQQSGGGSYIEPGYHRLKIDKIVDQESRKNPGVWNYIVETSVVSSRALTPDAAPAHMPGDKVTWLVNLSWPSAKDNVNGFCCALANCAPKAITEEAVEALVGANQPARGTLIDVHAYHTPTRSGGVYTKCNWSHVAAENNGEAAAAPANA